MRLPGRWQLFLPVALSLGIFFSGASFCQAAPENPKPAPKPSPPPEAKSSEAQERSVKKDLESASLVQRIRALTPEQRARLIENIKAWEQLTPELKEALVAREKAIRKSLSEEIQQALEGTQFSAEQRELFEKRYKEERRKLEATLKAEMETRRKAALEEIVSRLKQTVVKPDAP